MSRKHRFKKTDNWTLPELIRFWGSVLSNKQKTIKNMATEKTISRVKLVIDDKYERFTENDTFTGVTFKYEADGTAKIAHLTIPKKRENDTSTPPQNLTPVDGVKWGYYQNKKGVVYKMNVNDELIISNGVEWVTEKFRQATKLYYDILKSKVKG